MARIAGVDIPREKRIEIALTYLYGIGRSVSNQILSQAGIDPNKRTNMLSEEEVARDQGHYRSGAQDRGRSPQRDQHQYKEADGHRLLPGPEAQKGAAGPWPEDENEFEDEERTTQDLDEEKEVRGRNGEGAKDRQKEGQEEYPRRGSAYTVELQQHYHHHSGPSGKRGFVVERRHCRF